MAGIERDGERILISSEYRERELCKRVPGARWDRNVDMWYVPLSWAACVVLRGIFGQELAVGPELATWANAEYAGRVLPSMQARVALDALGHEQLWPFQRGAASFLEVA